MKTASLKQVKEELSYKSDQELVALCLQLIRFKKDNKELLSYLLFEMDDDDGICSPRGILRIAPGAARGRPGLSL